MAQIRIKLDLPFEYVLRISALIGDNAHECERLERFFDEREKSEYSQFYGMLANKAHMIKEALDLQMQDAKNVYYRGGDEDESARA